MDGRFDALGIAGVSADGPGPRPALATWLGLLEQWNARIDLTAARTPDELCDLMLADAVFLAPRVARGARVIDVGTGAGAPGLALALLRPDLKLTLVDPLAKRVSFLRTVIGTLGRTDITLVQSRVENMTKTHRSSFDVAISRATLAPSAWVPLGLELAPETWALLAREGAPTVAGATLVDDIAYTWPLTAAERHAAKYNASSFASGGA